VWAAVRQLHEESITVLLVTHEMDEAEALCGRVVVMRDGRVLDAGAPADLVDRYAGTATIRFSLPDAPAALLDQVRRLDGVHEVERSGARVTVRGARPVIAHVGAVLVRWGSVPAHLSVHVPSLEDALLGTLLPSARSAQAVGLLLFFPSFLLGAGGPPPNVMGSAVRHVAGPLPLTLLTNAVRGPWLGLGPAAGSLIGLAALTVLFTVAAARRAVL